MSPKIRKGESEARRDRTADDRRTPRPRAADLADRVALAVLGALGRLARRLGPA